MNEAGAIDICEGDEKISITIYGDINIVDIIEHIKTTLGLEVGMDDCTVEFIEF